LSEVEFHSEISPIAPAQVELKSTAMIIHKWQPQHAIAAHSPIPSAIWIGDAIGIAANACEMFVANPNHVMIEVMKRVAHVPHEFSAALAFPIIRRWNWIIGVLKPPDWVQLAPDAEFLRRLGRMVVNLGSFVG